MPGFSIANERIMMHLVTESIALSVCQPRRPMMWVQYFSMTRIPNTIQGSGYHANKHISKNLTHRNKHIAYHKVVIFLWLCMRYHSDLNINNPKMPFYFHFVLWKQEFNPRLIICSLFTHPHHFKLVRFLLQKIF